MDLQLFQSITKYPFIHDGQFYDSFELNQNKTCTEKCNVKDCINMLSKTRNHSEYVCSKGYDNVLIILGDFKFILNGLIYTSNTTVPPGRREVRKDWIQSKEAVNLFIDKIDKIEKHLNLRENETTVKNFSIFHDFKTSMNIFFTCTQDIISSLPGATFEEKLKGGEKSYQDLYHALRLITSQLRMIDIFVNPKSILFGDKKSVNMFQLFDKMRILFNHLAIKKRDISIRILADRHVNDSICYDSIEFIPLILLDNALKYSVGDSEIEIKLEQGHKKVRVIVKNIGPFVKDENKDKIFDKFFRDDYAQEFARDGLGIGLWMGQQIMNSHGSKLTYFRDPRETRSIGLNIFQFELGTE